MGEFAIDYEHAAGCDEVQSLNFFVEATVAMTWIPCRRSAQADRTSPRVHKPRLYQLVCITFFYISHLSDRSQYSELC